MIKTRQEPCAWCESSSVEDSHGICQDCADQMEAQSKQRQFDRVPSYVERFRDEKRYKDRYGKEAR